MNFEGELYGKLYDLDERLKGVGPLGVMKRVRRRLLRAVIVTYPGRWTEDLETVWAERAEAEFKDGYGNPIVIYLLSWLAAEGVKLLIKWLIERRNHELLLMGWKHHATQG